MQRELVAHLHNEKIGRQRVSYEYGIGRQTTQNQVRVSSKK